MGALQRGRVVEYAVAFLQREIRRDEVLIGLALKFPVLLYSIGARKSSDLRDYISDEARFLHPASPMRYTVISVNLMTFELQGRFRRFYRDVG